MSDREVNYKQNDNDSYEISTAISFAIGIDFIILDKAFHHSLLVKEGACDNVECYRHSTNDRYNSYGNGPQGTFIAAKAAAIKIVVIFVRL